LRIHVRMLLSNHFCHLGLSDHLRVHNRDCFKKIEVYCFFLSLLVTLRFLENIGCRLLSFLNPVFSTIFRTPVPEGGCHKATPCNHFDLRKCTLLSLNTRATVGTQIQFVGAFLHSVLQTSATNSERRTETVLHSDLLSVLRIFLSFFVNIHCILL
jgi:hypothetical protein